MDKRWTIGLLVVLALLLIYIFGVQEPQQQAAATQTAASPSAGAPTTLFNTTADTVLAVEITDRTRDLTVRFGRESNTAAWAVQAPESGPADQLQAASAVAGLANLSYTSEVTATTDLTAFGVLSPTYQITLTTTSGQRRLDVGDEVPLTGGRYAAVDGQAPAYTLSQIALDPILALIDTPPFLAPTADPNATAEASPTP